MYAAYFGLSEAPFSIAPDPRYLYMSARHREALAHLLYGISANGGFVQLTGEVGTGKTTVCRCFLEQLPPDTDVALILNPRLNEVELLASVCDELRIAYPHNIRSIKKMVDRINRYLLDAHARGRKTVLVIDEAQNLAPDVLELLRLLTNLETASQKLLRLVLVGQPELAEMLARPELRQLAQRVTARYHLDALDAAETAAYVRHRLAVARQDRPLFSDAALKIAHRQSRGIPRVLNLLCDRALLGAYASDRQQVDARIMRRAVREVLGGGKRAWWAAGAAALIAIAALGAWWQHDRPAGGEASVQAPAPNTLAALGEREESHALSRLAAEWGAAGEEGAPVTDCTAAETAGLRCYAARGNWNTLRALDRPALLELTADDGSPVYVIVRGFDDGRVRVDVAGETRRVDRALIDRAWLGRFTTLWRPPTGYAGPIATGQSAAAVPWLRETLARLTGPLPAAADPSVYDKDLAARVREFQRAHGLAADGVAGVETVMRLAAEDAGVHEPHLEAANPG